MAVYSLRTLLFALKAKPQIFALAFLGTFLFFGIRSRYFEESSALQPLKDTGGKPGHPLHERGNSPIVTKGNQESSTATQDFSFTLNTWDLLIQQHTEYQPIGNVWDKCDNRTRITIGKVVLEPNDAKTGVKMSMLSNLTFKNDVDGGTANLDVYFKDRILYRKKYDLCDKLSRLEEPIPCPFKKGHVLVLHRLVEMPSYLPKGRYKVHLHAKDQLGNQFACAELEFKTKS